MVIEVDKNNSNKDIPKLDIEIPTMSPRIQREYKNLSELDVSKFGNIRVEVKTFNKEEIKEIIFKDVVEEKFHHKIPLTGEIESNYQNVIGFFAKSIMRELRLFGCYDILFGKVKEFVQNNMFDKTVDLMDVNILQNLSEVEYSRLIKDSFKKAINDLTVNDSGDAEIKNYIKISDARPFVVNDKSYLIPKKSVFNKIVGDSDFELTFSSFLENCEDIISFAKNYQNKEASALRIEYKNSEGFIATYYPDFFVKSDEKTVYIIETKGREEENNKLKFERLQKWCEDVNNRQNRVIYKSLYIKQEEWKKDKLKNFSEVVRIYNNK
jgi:type III restriction enzyme